MLFEHEYKVHLNLYVAVYIIEHMYCITSVTVSVPFPLFVRMRSVYISIIVSSMHTFYSVIAKFQKNYFQAQYSAYL